MDTTIVIYILWIVVILGIVARLLASDGWKLGPAFMDNGKFQLNVIPIIIFGALAAAPILQTVDLNANLIYLIFTVFVAVYGTPSALDHIGNFILPTPTTVTPSDSDTTTVTPETPEEENVEITAPEIAEESQKEE
jgi:hypothetical protein